MAKFLNTTGISYHLEELITNTKDKLILISPYLQFNQRIKEHIRSLTFQKRDIRIVYRENKLQIEENEWLEAQIGVRRSFCKNLHAKCYMNESEAIITSMNLYEFSQVNNNEMGIYITKADDPDLFNATLQEAQRLLEISDEIRVTVERVQPNKHESMKLTPEPPKTKKPSGFCIRTGNSITFNIEKPVSYEAFIAGGKTTKPDAPEKFCHFSGEPSNGETSINRPILKKNWKKAQEVFGLK